MAEDRNNDAAERLIKVLGALGFNEVKMRWRLRRWATGWQRWRRRAEQRTDQIKYRHTACPNCRAVNDRAAKVCASCGERMPARALVMLDRLGLIAPQVMSVSSLLGLAMVIGYVRLLIAAPGDGIVTVPIAVLIDHGGQFPEAVFGAGEWWRLSTAVFLHAGLWHIGFNLLALASVGPQVEQLFGRMAMAVFFMTTGIIASLGSALAHQGGVSIGASGAVMGLVGVAAGWGHRDGTSIGRQVRNDMLKWTAYVVIFGLVIGADNVAHLVGLVAGGAIGFAVTPRFTRSARARPYFLLAGAVALVAAAASAWLVLSPPANADRWTREPAPVLEVPPESWDSFEQTYCGRRLPADWPDEARHWHYRQCQLIDEARRQPR